jgi:hypothetical protein
MPSAPSEQERLMSARHETRPPEEHVSGWALGAIVFAATITTMIGVFQVVVGLAAIFNDEFFVVTKDYAFDLDVGTWGWIQLILGLAAIAVGGGLFARATWAGVTAIVIAFLSALGNFFFVPYYPIWALVVIGLDIWLIWALTRPGATS